MRHFFFLVEYFIHAMADKEYMYLFYGLNLIDTQSELKPEWLAISIVTVVTKTTVSLR